MHPTADLGAPRLFNKQALQLGDIPSLTSYPTVLLYMYSPYTLSTTPKVATFGVEAPTSHFSHLTTRQVLPRLFNKEALLFLDGDENEIQAALEKKAEAGVVADDMHGVAASTTEPGNNESKPASAKEEAFLAALAASHGPGPPPVFLEAAGPNQRTTTKEAFPVSMEMAVKIEVARDGHPARCRM